MRNERNFNITDDKNFLKQALKFASSFNHFSYLNHNNIPYLYHGFDQILAIGSYETINFDHEDDPFFALKQFVQGHAGWLFGYLGYDLKNSIEDLSSGNHDRLGFKDICFYVPTHLLRFSQGQVKISSMSDPEEVFSSITAQNNGVPESKNINFQASISSEDYLSKVQKIKEHILEGDIYELNFCMEFFAENAVIDPLQVYQRLNRLSPMPFSAFSRFGEHFLMSASPERFLKKESTMLISQPIKGTARRSANPEEDEKIKHELQNDEKELAENMMIVDLVRNDLARSSKAGTVKVPELFGLYSFQQVHQLISTVTSDLKDNVHYIDAIKNAFPMGSMTGAPKVMAMKLIEQYEESRRGLYSGAMGYIDPLGNFDFNVVIRSLLYNNNTKTLSFQVGSAITFDSDPEKEYEECLLKASAMIKVFNL